MGVLLVPFYHRRGFDASNPYQLGCGDWVLMVVGGKEWFLMRG
jgi:hypothetical protein